MIVLRAPKNYRERVAEFHRCTTEVANINAHTRSRPELYGSICVASRLEKRRSRLHLANLCERLR
jgi:hypothetical protein